MTKYELIARIQHPEKDYESYGWNKAEFPEMWMHYKNLCKSIIRKDVLNAARILITEFPDESVIVAHPKWNQELVIDIDANGIYLYEKLSEVASRTIPMRDVVFITKNKAYHYPENLTMINQFVNIG